MTRHENVVKYVALLSTPVMQYTRRISHGVFNLQEVDPAREVRSFSWTSRSHSSARPSSLVPRFHFVTDAGVALRRVAAMLSKHH